MGGVGAVDPLAQFVGELDGQVAGAETQWSRRGAPTVRQTQMMGQHAADLDAVLVLEAMALDEIAIRNGAAAPFRRVVPHSRRPR
ncbi:hypothetical protein GCM10010251_10990 [Streptomyces aurantiogriseus]|uniref:Uncharacterized protein n=1 Tax=Streptomyces aurantiogriseus TaxID=66870 RepID=A0A918BXY2_9ACTN|nr:hypothetical protein GCM10010251_10990 [Streptomyces aurantiogriseus]